MVHRHRLAAAQNQLAANQVMDRINANMGPPSRQTNLIRQPVKIEIIEEERSQEGVMGKYHKTLKQKCYYYGSNQ